MILGSISCAIAVIIGAFGAHSLKSIITSESLVIYKTGVTYHFFHSIGLIILAFIFHLADDSKYLRWAAKFMFTGIILFSFSLYILSITEIRMFGIITPFGGLSFIISWVLITIAIIKLK